MLLDYDYQKKQSSDRGAVAGPDCDLEATAQLQLAPHASEESGNTAGLGLPRIEAWESGGKLGNQRPKRDPNLAKRAAVGRPSQGESRSHGASPVASVRARTRIKAAGQPAARASISVNALALALCAFFILTVLASCVAASSRGGDSFVPRELN